MDYSQHMLARAEHEWMVKSVPKVPEYGCNVLEHKNVAQRRPLNWIRAIFIAILQLLTK